MYLLALILALVGLALSCPFIPSPPARTIGWFFVAAGVLVQLFATSGSVVHW
jgi:hypothetical protein